MAKVEPSEFDFDRALKRISGTEEEARIAFKELHNFFGTAVYIVGKRFLKSQELADDLVQDVFTKVWNKRKEISHVSDFQDYIIGLTKLEALKLLRHRAMQLTKQAIHLEMMEAQRAALVSPKDSEKFDKLVELLPSPRQQIFKARIKGMRGTVIADNFKMSLDTVYWHISQSIKFIKERRHDIISFLAACIAGLLAQ
jgi:RNA polymerase sigma factor (sigma-70 family)